jgi:hypothetical protein
MKFLPIGYRFHSTFDLSISNTGHIQLTYCRIAVKRGSNLLNDHPPDDVSRKPKHVADNERCHRGMILLIVCVTHIYP